MRSSLILDLSDCTEFRQRLQARPRRIIHGTALLLAALLGTAFAWAALTEADLVVRAPGRVRPVETPTRVFNPVRGETLSGSTGGRVVEINFREGDEVKKGDVLLRFDTERIDNEITRQRQIIQAGEEELTRLAHMGDLLARQFETARAKAEAEGEQVREEVRRTRERQAAEVRLAQAELESARDEEARLSQLVARRAAAPAELVQATARRQVAEEKLERARVPVEGGRLEVLRQALVLVEKESAVRREELAQKRASKQAEVQAARIELSNLELEQEQAVLVAPRDGVITAGEVKVGDLLEPGRPVLEIAGRRAYRFEVAVPSEEVGHLRVAMPVRIKMDAYDYQKYGTLEGTIDFISPDSRVAEGKGSAIYLVRVALDQDEVGQGPHRGKIKLGMMGQAEVITGQETILALLVKKIRQSISLG
jgi:multidrug efflux pump subunit AcrA (membrane-fusion protein)